MSQLVRGTEFQTFQIRSRLLHFPALSPHLVTLTTLRGSGPGRGGWAPSVQDREADDVSKDIHQNLLGYDVIDDDDVTISSCTTSTGSADGLGSCDVSDDDSGRSDHPVSGWLSPSSVVLSRKDRQQPTTALAAINKEESVDDGSQVILNSCAFVAANQNAGLLKIIPPSSVSTLDSSDVIDTLWDDAIVCGHSEAVASVSELDVTALYPRVLASDDSPHEKLTEDDCDLSRDRDNRGKVIHDCYPQQSSTKHFAVDAPEHFARSTALSQTGAAASCIDAAGTQECSLPPLNSTDNTGSSQTVEPGESLAIKNGTRGEENRAPEQTMNRLRKRSFFRDKQKVKDFTDGEGDSDIEVVHKPEATSAMAAGRGGGIWLNPEDSDQRRPGISGSSSSNSLHTKRRPSDGGAMSAASTGDYETWRRRASEGTYTHTAGGTTFVLASADKDLADVDVDSLSDPGAESDRGTGKPSLTPDAVVDVVSSFSDGNSDRRWTFRGSGDERTRASSPQAPPNWKVSFGEDELERTNIDDLILHQDEDRDDPWAFGANSSSRAGVCPDNDNGYLNKDDKGYITSDNLPVSDLDAWTALDNKTRYTPSPSPVLDSGSLTQAFDGTATKSSYAWGVQTDGYVFQAKFGDYVEAVTCFNNAAPTTWAENSDATSTDNLQLDELDVSDPERVEIREESEPYPAMHLDILKSERKKASEGIYITGLPQEDVDDSDALSSTHGNDAYRMYPSRRQVAAFFAVSARHVNATLPTPAGVKGTQSPLQKANGDILTNSFQSAPRADLSGEATRKVIDWMDSPRKKSRNAGKPIETKMKDENAPTKTPHSKITTTTYTTSPADTASLLRPTDLPLIVDASPIKPSRQTSPRSREARQAWRLRETAASGRQTASSPPAVQAAAEVATSTARPEADPRQVETEEEKEKKKKEEEEDLRTEHQRRLDAWVSSVQLHWDSSGSGQDFPYSFEDHLRLPDVGLDSTTCSDFPESEYEELELTLLMADDERRFGFSIIGGYDEGIMPRVDDVTPRSPADRAELEIGDEIVEVNGKCVERCSHSEIITHIHQCIRSKSIRLRVKRLKEGEKVPVISKVHDAYIIAVEENARRKLEDVSANHRVVPFDMTKGPPLELKSPRKAVTSFSTETSASVPHPEADSNLCDHAEVYSSGQEISLKCLEDSTNGDTPKQLINTNLSTVRQSQLVSASSPAKPPRQSKTELFARLQNAGEAANQQNQKQEILLHKVVEGTVSTVLTSEKIGAVDASSMPVAEKRRKTGSPSKLSNGGSLEAIEMNGMMEQERESPRKGKGKKPERNSKSNPETPIIEDMLGPKGRSPQNGNASRNHSFNHSSNYDLANAGYDLDDYVGGDHSTEDSFSDTGPHREMAIDCPDSFVAVAKTPPRYPPPQSTPGQTLSATTPRVPPTTPSKNTNYVNNDKRRTDTTLNDAAAAVAVASQQKPTSEQLERLRHHQEELRKRREEENRQAHEQEFLRTSLRRSAKLQALENRHVKQEQSLPPSGFDNAAYMDMEDDEQGGDFMDDVDGVEMSMPSELYIQKNAGVEDLLSMLHHIRTRLSAADNTSSSQEGHQEVAFLKHLFHNERFQHAVTIHQKMVEVTSRAPQPRPLGMDCQELAADVCASTPPRGLQPAHKELITLLNRPLLKNLMKAHDEVAEKQTHSILNTSETDLTDYPFVQYGEESVKIVHLEKTNEHLGATVKNEGDSVIIARIVKGGAAEKSGLLHEGDEILDVNGIDMRGKNVNEVSEILANMSGVITFMIIPTHTCMDDSTSKSGEMMHLRAMFNYDPEDDPYIPCRELGISFIKGDILHAMQLTDANWWQAHREGEEEQPLAGLVPSRSFQEQRVTVQQQLAAEGKENKKRSRICVCGRKERRKKKKNKQSLYNGGVTEEPEEILTYEEVSLYYPQPNRKRPVVLIGPPDVGRQELREHVMETDFDRFAAAVPHTSRAPARGEEHGRDYYFVSRAEFEADMLNGKLVEYGEYQNNMYGTSIEAVRRVINQGKICILNLQPETLKVLRETDLKPYIVFVSPPNLEKLRQLQTALGKFRPTDESLKECIERGRKMEEMYGHYFDFVLVNMDLDRARDELLQEINRIETEPQWVPAAWVNGY